MNTGDDAALEGTLAGYAEWIFGALDTRVSIGSPVYLYEAAQHPIRARSDSGRRCSSSLQRLWAPAWKHETDQYQRRLPSIGSYTNP